MTIKHSRYALVVAFYLTFIAGSFCIRTILLAWIAPKSGIGILGLFKIYSLGFLYDVIVASCFMVLYSLYLLVIPERMNRSLANKILTLFFYPLTMLIVLFSFLAEITFWQEFESRFNFIAVDYLVYTYEVIHNINESYPIPLLVGGMLAVLSGILWIMKKRSVFKNSFHSTTPFKQRLLYTGLVLLVAFGGLALLNNDLAERGNNRYSNELSKAGIFSFFAAFKNNELNYDQFYKVLPTDKAFSIMRKELGEENTSFSNKSSTSVDRFIKDSGALQQPNVIMVTIESLSADFLGAFGNKDSLTPVLDALAASGTSFTNMYATGTRTVRGMEALSLAVPPTPGSSIVRRPGNNDLTTIGNIFNHAGYETSFLYGGDGYFDNMNQYFGSNGYTIIDRGRNLPEAESYDAKRIHIPDSKVNFENAWGICDGDLYDAVIGNADSLYSLHKLFYDFVMTTSNHRPFTFPANKITLPPGTRNSAVRYTDYAIGAFLKKASARPWYNNTVFIFVADHCASSAGKNEIDISKYHIPCIIFRPNAKGGKKIEGTCSQIDLYPTLFAMLHWRYESNLYGTNVLDPHYKSRILLGTYQKLAYMTHDSLVVLSPQQKVDTYLYNSLTNTQTASDLGDKVIEKAIASYQTAYYLFKHDELKHH